MYAILKREFKSFFGSPIGYLVIGVFLIVNGLLLFVFDGPHNILNSGFADLTPFFTLAPWVLLFLIPAVTMRSFSDEMKLGTLELLLTKPLSKLQIVGGKFLGTMLLIVLALLPTLVYPYIISDYILGSTTLDYGSITGSYFGLFFLVAAYSAIGVFCSSLTENQIVAFLLSVAFCFMMYYGFEAFAPFTGGFDKMVASIGMDEHYRSMARGVLDTRDVVYFLSISVFFILLTAFKLKKQTENKPFSAMVKKMVVPIGMLIAANLAGLVISGRFDLTHDNRYTLSETTLRVVNGAVEPLYVDVFLKGNLPGEFKRLQTEINQLLEEFKAYNPNIIFQFVNPLEDTKEADATMRQFLERGLTPVNVTIDDKGKQIQETLFPWAVATYGTKSIKVPLLKNNMGATSQENVQNSVQHLEYAFTNAFHTITHTKQKKVAVVKGNGELHDLLIADFVRNLRDNYYIGPFTLDSVAKQPLETLKYLKKYDLAIIAKPTEKFTDEEKQVLDQYIMSGGKTIWLIDQVHMEMDSLYNETGSAMAFPIDLNLNDLFFKYGLRLQNGLVKDLMATPIALATGERNNVNKFTQYPWFYSPLVFPSEKHPISTNVDGVKFEFANGIELLKNDIKKQVLLASSPYSKNIGAPVAVTLEMVEERPEPAIFKNTGLIPMAVLLEGSFHSMYENRVLPFKDSRYKKKGNFNKMIVISDGDVIKNQFDKNYQPLELGYDKWTNKFYGNKEFLMNCVNYLLDDDGLINIRNKEVSMALLDREKVYSNFTQIELLSIVIPLAILIVFGFIFYYWRKKKFAT